jgi:outer membrane lipoprotein-sorting protein
MRMNVLLLSFLVAATTLAGCAESAATPEDAFAEEFEDLQATETTGVIRGLVVDSSINPV